MSFLTTILVVVTMALLALSGGMLLLMPRPQHRLLGLLVLGAAVLLGASWWLGSDEILLAAFTWRSHGQ